MYFLSNNLTLAPSGTLGRCTAYSAARPVMSWTYKMDEDIGQEKQYKFLIHPSPVLLMTATLELLNVPQCTNIDGWGMQCKMARAQPAAPHECLGVLITQLFHLPGNECNQVHLGKTTRFLQISHLSTCYALAHFGRNKKSQTAEYTGTSRFSGRICKLLWTRNEGIPSTTLTPHALEGLKAKAGPRTSSEFMRHLWENKGCTWVSMDDCAWRKIYKVVLCKSIWNSMRASEKTAWA